MTELQGKTFIITGASSGIGRATAKKLVENGANVALAARRLERLNEIKEELSDQPGEIIVKETDVTSREQMEELGREAVNHFGKVYGLFNNAGLMPLSLLKNQKVDEWDQMVDVNIKGVLYGINAILPHMIENNDGHIISTSSVAAHQIFPGSSVYSGTKFAVKAIMMGLEQEVAQTNIRTTAISPGVVNTELTETITDNEVMEQFDSVLKVQQLNSEDIAEAVYYALTQPAHVDVNEIVVRPVDQP